MPQSRISRSPNHVGGSFNAGVRHATSSRVKRHEFLQRMDRHSTPWTRLIGNDTRVGRKLENPIHATSARREALPFSCDEYNRDIGASGGDHRRYRIYLCMYVVAAKAVLDIAAGEQRPLTIKQCAANSSFSIQVGVSAYPPRGASQAAKVSFRYATFS